MDFINRLQSGAVVGVIFIKLLAVSKVSSILDYKTKSAEGAYIMQLTFQRTIENEGSW